MAIYSSRSPVQNFNNQRFWIRKKSALLNLIKEQDDIDEIYLHARDLSEANYEFLTKKSENTGITHLNDPKTFTECSNTMDNFCEKTEELNTTRKRKALIAFHDMIADIMSNKNCKLS